MSGWGGNFVYNPYVTDGSPPPPAELSVNMTGPDGGTQDLQYTWTAQVAGGTPPYTYQWGGVMGSGTGSVFTRTLQASGDLYLDVWDAAGTHIAVSRWIEAVQNCGGLAC